MRYRWLGTTGLYVSEIGFGAWAIGGSMWGPQDDFYSRQALHQALNMGCNFIDTALAYGNGHSERLIASVLQERGERAIIATKVRPKNLNWNNSVGTPLEDVFSAESIQDQVETSLRNLKTECIDVLQLHTWNREWNDQCSSVLKTIAELKQAGKIRAFGISLKDKEPNAANELIQWRQVDVLQVFFNLLYQEPISKLFPILKKYKIGMIARVPLAFGALSGRFNAQTIFLGDDHRKNLYRGSSLQETLLKVKKLQFLAASSKSMAETAIQWTLAYPEVSTTIPGIRNLRQAIDNCKAGELPPLKDSWVRKAEKLYNNNFGRPIQTIDSTAAIHAVFMSGFKLRASKKHKSAKIKTRSSKIKKTVKRKRVVKIHKKKGSIKKKHK